MARHFWISGRVQGVSFRFSAQARATELGLSGWVRNLPDGRVEALAQGEAAALDDFERWLWRGPAPAKVEDVEVQSEPGDHDGRFEIR